MAGATQRAPKRRRQPRDPSARVPRPFKRKGVGRKEGSGVQEKRRRRKKERNRVEDARERRANSEEEKGKDVERGEKGSEAGRAPESSSFLLSTAPVPQQLRFFLKQFESANKFKISSLELEAVTDTCIVKLAQGINQDVDSLCKHVKYAFGESWKEDLQDGKLLKGKVDAGSPALLILSISALRSLELLRGLRQLTRECRPAKLFAKHIKVDDQVSLLKNRVNIASGTPSRVKKLIDMEALALSRLSVIILDLHKDAKGFSLFTLPQVRDEFWDLYKSHFHQRLLQGDLRICFYGPTSITEFEKTQTKDEP